MNQRLVDFIQALRGAGVRVSLAESADALRALEQVGIRERQIFRLALKSTLVKDAQDGAKFDELFDLFFAAGAPPATQPQLTPDEQAQLGDALRQMAAQLAELLRRLLDGDSLSDDELREAGQRAGLEQATRQYQQRWISRRMEHDLGLDRVEELLRALLAELARRGLTPEALEELAGAARENRDGISEQIERYVGQQLARREAEERRREPAAGELAERPFSSLSERELSLLREEVRRLAARLRTRIALRRRRGKSGLLDAKATLRASLRTGGLPIELHLRRRRRKARLLLLCDLSTSMRPVVEFLLHLVYQLQDEVAHTRSFAYIDRLVDISEPFTAMRLQQAIDFVLRANPPGYYNTDLGRSLGELVHGRLDALDRRTTVIVLGDGRNNYNDPRLDALATLKRHARRVIWLTPEPRGMWGEGDSDMLTYLPLCDAVHQVASLAQLSRAIDHILAD